LAAIVDDYPNKFDNIKGAADGPPRNEYSSITKWVANRCFVVGDSTANAPRLARCLVHHRTGHRRESFYAVMLETLDAAAATRLYDSLVGQVAGSRLPFEKDTEQRSKDLWSQAFSASRDADERFDEVRILVQRKEEMFTTINNKMTPGGWSVTLRVQSYREPAEPGLNDVNWD